MVFWLKISEKTVFWHNFCIFHKNSYGELETYQIKAKSIFPRNFRFGKPQDVFSGLFRYFCWDLACDIIGFTQFLFRGVLNIQKWSISVVVHKTVLTRLYNSSSSVIRAQILTVFASIFDAKTVKFWAKSVEPIKSYRQFSF